MTETLLTISIGEFEILHEKKDMELKLDGTTLTLSKSELYAEQLFVAYSSPAVHSQGNTSA